MAYTGGWDHAGPADLAGYPPGLGGFFSDLWNGAKKVGGAVWDVLSGGQSTSDPRVFAPAYPDPYPPPGGYSGVNVDTTRTTQGEPWWRYVLRTAGAAALAALVRELGPRAWAELPPEVQGEVIRAGAQHYGQQFLGGIPPWVLWGGGLLLALRIARVI